MLRRSGAAGERPLVPLLLLGCLLVGGRLVAAGEDAADEKPAGPVLVSAGGSR